MTKATDVSQGQTDMWSDLWYDCMFHLLKARLKAKRLRTSKKGRWLQFSFGIVSQSICWCLYFSVNQECKLKIKGGTMALWSLCNFISNVITQNNTEICHCSNIYGLHLYFFRFGRVGDWWRILWWLHYLETWDPMQLKSFLLFISVLFLFSLSFFFTRERKGALFVFSWFYTAQM